MDFSSNLPGNFALKNGGRKRSLLALGSHTPCASSSQGQSSSLTVDATSEEQAFADEDALKDLRTWQHWGDANPKRRRVWDCSSQKEADFPDISIDEATEEDCTVTLLREHYPWSSAFRQASFAYRLFARQSTRVYFVRRLLARILKVARDRIYLASEKQILEDQGLIEENMVLTWFVMPWDPAQTAKAKK